MYHIFRRQCNFSARSLTLTLLAIFITLNLVVYTKFNTLVWRTYLEPEVERREIDRVVRSSRHPFSEQPQWMSSWLAHQQLDPNLTTTEGAKLKFDIVYTWVNGTDPKLQKLKKQYQEKSPFFASANNNRPSVGRLLRLIKPDNSNRRFIPEGMTESDLTANRFRDMNELKYSVRSVAEYASQAFKRIHILVTQVDPDMNEAQMPSWLDPEKSTDVDVVRIVHHSDIFEDLSALPSFNSLAIESQIHHTPDLTDIFMYLNDDVFLGTTILPSDIWTPLYGFVFHLEPSLLVPPQIIPLADNTFEIGEWNSLQYSNHILSKQFGSRNRAYVAHIPHVLSVPMLQEIQEIWPEEFAQTSSHRFRGEGDALDVQVSFFMAHYVLERQRETQLDSFWQYRLDANQDGVLDWNEREQLIQRINLWNKLNPVRNRGGQVESLSSSSFLDEADVYLRQLGMDPSGSTTYMLSGMDGFPFMLKNASTASSVLGQDQTPYTAADEPKSRTCQLNLDFCFGPAFQDEKIQELDNKTSSKIFQRLAFKEFHCGDCLLLMLRQTSKEPGLGSDIMPLNKSSEAFAKVSNDLAKYNYVAGASYYSFVQLDDIPGSRSTLAGIMSRKDTDSFMCINDHIINDPIIQRTVRETFQQFLDNRFPTPSPWETKSD